MPVTFSFHFSNQGSLPVYSEWRRISAVWFLLICGVHGNPPASGWTTIPGHGKSLIILEPPIYTMITPRCCHKSQPLQSFVISVDLLFRRENRHPFISTFLVKSNNRLWWKHQSILVLVIYLHNIPDVKKQHNEFLIYP
jgi:hypothetical protein